MLGACRLDRPRPRRGFDSTVATFYLAGVTLSKPSVSGAVLALVLLATGIGGAIGDASGQPPDPASRVRNRADRAARTMRVGDAKLRLGDLRGACGDYAKAIEILPSWWMPRLAIVRCGRFTGLPLKTLTTHAEFAVRARPEIPITHVQYGLVLEEAGDLDAAIAAYQAALRRHSALPEARYRLGMLLSRRRRYKAATRHLEHAVAMRPLMVQARAKLAHLYEKVGRIADAESGLVELLTRSRNPRLAFSRLIRFYRRQGMAKRERTARQRYRKRFHRGDGH